MLSVTSPRQVCAMKISKSPMAFIRFFTLNIEISEEFFITVKIFALCAYLQTLSKDDIINICYGIFILCMRKVDLVQELFLMKKEERKSFVTDWKAF